MNGRSHFWALWIVFLLASTANAGGQDCNSNGVADDQDIASGTSLDCVAFDCCLPYHGGPSCSDSTVAACVCGVSGEEFCCSTVWDDECVGILNEWPCGVCAGNGIPDECEPDCNGNGVPDACDIPAGTSPDCQGNSIPDEYETDCNCNGVPDSADLAAGTSNDCEADGVPDECGCDVDIVFIVDTSGSMILYGDAELDPSFCTALDQAVETLRQYRTRFRATLLVMAN